MSLTVSSPERTQNRPRGLRSRLLNTLLNRLQHGSLRVVLPDGSVCERSTQEPHPQAVLVLKRWRPLRRLLLEGDAGFAEAFLDGDWTTPDLFALMQLGLLNEDALSAGRHAAVLTRVLHRLSHRLNGNTRLGSQRNIAAHYDLGNDFYAAWLDRDMSYSSALFTTPDQSLEAAQRVKQDRAIALLGPASDQSVLEIGCGWGSLAERLAERGAHVTPLTLSQAQLHHARGRLDRYGARAEPRLQDYRDVTGRFDAVVSIEMFEAVGEAYWPVFFDRLRDLLRPGGVAVLQIITIDAARFATYRATPDFIQRHIFPGGMLPTESALRTEAERAGLKLDHEERFGESYARTLRCWSERFEAAWPALVGGVFDERFRRKWRYYLAYCEAGFRGSALDVGFYRFVRP